MVPQYCSKFLPKTPRLRPQCGISDGEKVLSLDATMILLLYMEKLVYNDINGDQVSIGEWSGIEYGERLEIASDSW